MLPYRLIIAGLWLVFGIYWLAAAPAAKRTTRGRMWRRHTALRVALIVLIVALLQSRSIRQTLAGIHRLVGYSPLLGASGLALCVLGFGLAFSARHYLGRNWGPPMSRKEHPHLVTGGPYSIIRHPIYTGLIVAMIGSAIGFTILWALLLVPAGIYFIYSARQEEAFMLQQFPREYAAYRARTGMLLPCPLRRGPDART